MVKKKSTKNLNNDDSSSDCDDKPIATVANNNDQENGIVVEKKCTHVQKATDCNKLRKTLKENGIRETCTECVRKPTKVVADDDDLTCEYDTTLWLCLRCGSQLCGRAKNQHALAHTKVSRSEPPHNIAMNTTTYDIWCYVCDDSVQPSGYKALEECLEIVKKEQDKQERKKNELDEGQIGLIVNRIAPFMQTYNKTIEAETVAKNNEKNAETQSVAPTTTVASNSLENSVSLLPRARGLSNLGNTCFFNAVLQCLSQTPYLLDVLRRSSEPGEKFQLPGGPLMLSDTEEINLPVIDGELLSWGTLTSTLADTLEELQTNKGGAGVFKPSKLLTQLTNKWPQFAGGDQHDSHELLRHLLESVRSEDLRRYQALILNSLGLKTKIDPQKVDDDTKKKIKFYGEQAQDRILGPEPVFRGFLVSTLTCMDCHHTSSRHESFLDLSLPVFVEKSQPPTRRKNSPDPDQQSSYGTVATAAPSETATSPKKTVNKKLERKMKKTQKAQALQQLKQKNQQDFFGSSSSQGATTATEPDVSGAGDGSLDTTAVEAATNGSNSSSSVDSNEQSDADVEDNLDENGNPKKDDSDAPPPLLLDDTAAPPPLLFDDAESELLKETEKNHLVELALSQEGKNNLIKKIETINLNETSSPAAKPAAKVKKIDWSATLGQRDHCKDGECSIESCFNNFTASELMTGSNKVGCEACTERINGKNGKTINTNATKQFLISSPPGVLILHLKRFQVGPKHIFRKINKHVEFPLVLDIAPFCGMKVKNLPNINSNQKKLLYEIYGIVEHSGGMRGGHYVAYIKVRGKFNIDDPKWKFLPQGSKAECDQIDEHKAQMERMLSKEQQRNHQAEDSDDLSTTSSSDDGLEGAVGGDKNVRNDEVSDAEIPSKSAGKWYYVSDSFVREVSEENVLKAEAYLLFYERIY